MQAAKSTYLNNKKDLSFKTSLFSLPRQLPTFPGRHQPSIISVTELNFRVRNGYGCDLCAIATELLNTILVLLSTLCYLNSFLSFFWSSPRPISTSQLNTLLHLHLWPINLVVFKGSYYLKYGISYLEGGFTLRCLQRLSLPHLATQPCHWHDNWCTSGASIPVLSY